MRIYIVLFMAFNLGFSTLSMAVGLGEIKTALEIIPAAEKLGQLIGKYILDIHSSKRNGKRLRLQLKNAMPTMIQASDGRFGIGHMKGIEDYGNDYFLYAAPSDTHNLERLHDLMDNNKYEALANLANNDNFKMASSYKKSQFDLDKALNQVRLVVKDAFTGTSANSDVLYYSNLFPNYYQDNNCTGSDEWLRREFSGPQILCKVRSEVSLVELSTFLDQLLNAMEKGTIVLDENNQTVKDVAKVLSEHQENIYKNFWYKVPSEVSGKAGTNNQITVYIHIPTVLGVALAERKAGLR